MIRERVSVCEKMVLAFVGMTILHGDDGFLRKQPEGLNSKRHRGRGRLRIIEFRRWRRLAAISRGAFVLRTPAFALGAVVKMGPCLRRGDLAGYNILCRMDLMNPLTFRVSSGNMLGRTFGMNLIAWS